MRKEAVWCYTRRLSFCPELPHRGGSVGCRSPAGLPACTYRQRGGGPQDRYEKRAFKRLGGLKHKPPGDKAENFNISKADHVLVIRGLKIQVTQAVNVEFKPKIKDFSFSRNSVFSKNCKAVKKAENVNFAEKSIKKHPISRQVWMLFLCSHTTLFSYPARSVPGNIIICSTEKSNT